jgi:hypothetical protein
MQTVHDIQQQQVLDNLAMFTANPDAFPYFSLVTQGTSQIVDQGGATQGNIWTRTAGLFLFNQLTLTPSASRAATENWTLNPINDSIKLTVMRCAYQRVVGNCTGKMPSCSCPSCNGLFQAFYPLPQPSAYDSTITCQCNKGGISTQAAAVSAGGGSGQLSGLPHVSGIITPYCLNAQMCWYCTGCKHDIPKDCGCGFVGHYCDTYIWVPPQGRDELSKLVLLIQDIAYYNPPDAPSPPAMDVTLKPDPVPGATSVEIKATVPVGTNQDAILKADKVAALKRLVAQHGMTVYQLIDYWSHGVAGPGMTDQDVEDVAAILKELKIQLNKPDPLPTKAFCNATCNNQELATPEALVEIWSKGMVLPQLSAQDELALIDYYRGAGCNAITRLGIDTLNDIAYGALRKIPGDEQMARAAARRIAELELMPTVPQRTPSPIPYGFLGAAINLQNALPPAPAPLQ